MNIIILSLLIFYIIIVLIGIGLIFNNDIGLLYITIRYRKKYLRLLDLHFKSFENMYQIYEVSKEHKIVDYYYFKSRYDIYFKSERITNIFLASIESRTDLMLDIRGDFEKYHSIGMVTPMYSLIEDAKELSELVSFFKLKVCEYTDIPISSKFNKRIKILKSKYKNFPFS